MRQAIESLRHKSTSLSLTLIIGLGIMLRFYNLGAKSVWVDEAVTIFLARQVPSSLLSDYIHSTPGSLAGGAFQHDITTALLLYPITRFSLSEFCMRLLPAVAGTLSIGLIYWLGRLLFSVKVGFYSAFILAISPYNVWYSQMTRPFAFSAFFTLVSLCLFLQALERNRLWHWGLYALSSVLNVAVFYFALFILIAQAVYVLLWYRRDHQTLKYWFFSQVAIFVLLLPLVRLFASQITRRTSGAGISLGPSLLISYGSPWYAFTLGSLLPSPTHLLVALPALAIMGVLIIRAIWNQRQQRARLSFLLFYLFIPYFLSLLVRLVMSTITLARSLILLSPAYYILIALGILSLQNRKLRIIFLTLLIALSVFCLYAYYTTDIYQGLKLGANYIREHARDGDAVLHLNGSDRLTFEYYIRDEVPMYWTWGRELEAVKRGIAGGTADRVWVIAYHQLSTTERMMATYVGEGLADEQAYQSVDTLLRQKGFIKVEEIVFPGENRLTLGLYVGDAEAAGRRPMVVVGGGKARPADSVSYLGYCVCLKLQIPRR